MLVFLPSLQIDIRQFVELFLMLVVDKPFQVVYFLGKA
jgi:hypothetical protein